MDVASTSAGPAWSGPRSPDQYVSLPRCTALSYKRNTIRTHCTRSWSIESRHIQRLAQLLGSAAMASALAGQAMPAHASTWAPRRHVLHLEPLPFVFRELPVRKSSIPSNEHVVQWQRQRQGWMGNVALVWQKAQRAAGFQRKEMTISVAPPRELPLEAYGDGTRADLSWLGWWAFVLAGSIIVYTLAQRRFVWKRKKGQGSGGRWVRDRSLGGKMVFIPDHPIAPTRPLWDLEESGPGAVSSASNTLRAEQNQQRTTYHVPDWWQAAEAASIRSIGPTALAPLEEEAQQIVREAENAKAVGGHDYSTERLMQLANLGQQGGQALVTRPSTVGSREALLRRGIQLVMDRVADGTDSVNDDQQEDGTIKAAMDDSAPALPAEFVYALATVLGEAPERALALIRSELAATARHLIVAAEAEQRSRSGTEADDSSTTVSDDVAATSRYAKSLANLVRIFPMPASSPEVQAVGASVSHTISLAIRRRLFLQSASFARTTDAAVTLAELLGFEPSLVLPQLVTLLAG